MVLHLLCESALSNKRLLQSGKTLAGALRACVRAGGAAESRDVRKCEGARREGLVQEEKAVRSLRDLDRTEVLARRGELKGRVALFVATFGVALGLVNFTGSWFGLLPLLAVPYFMAKMARAQSELRALEQEGEM